MKALLLVPLTLALWAPALRAQEPHRSSVEAEPANSATAADPALDLMPAQPGQLLPPSSAQDPGLIPETPATTEQPRRGTSESKAKSKTQVAEEQLAELVRFRQARTKALQDPSFYTEWRAANMVRTDLQKREAFKTYYKRLYTRIRKIDPKLKVLADAREAETVHRLTQTRVTPTAVLDEAERSTSPTLSADFYSGDL